MTSNVSHTFTIPSRHIFRLSQIEKSYMAKDSRYPAIIGMVTETAVQSAIEATLMLGLNTVDRISDDLMSGGFYDTMMHVVDESISDLPDVDFGDEFYVDVQVDMGDLIREMSESVAKLALSHTTPILDRLDELGVPIDDICSVEVELNYNMRQVEYYVMTDLVE